MDWTQRWEQHNGELVLGGVEAGKLARTYGTPLYVMDEGRMRSKMQAYRQAMTGSRLEGEVLYASKAFLCQAMVRILAEEGLSLDVVSGGELYTALSAGFDASRIYFHGNNKSEAELAQALDAGVGCIILDNETEASRLIHLLEGTGRRQRVLVRINPGIEAHTHEYISTTRNDSKFGLSMFQPETAQFLRELAHQPSLELEGLHCHIGSQIFEANSFASAAEVMLNYLADLSRAGLSLKVLDLGGGFGVRYVSGDEPLEPEAFLPQLLELIADGLEARGLPPVRILIEPGRSIVAEAGVTLYTVGGTKATYGGTRYVFVDGSMADHIRTALYGASYEAVLAQRVEAPAESVYTVTGKACESGDILILGIPLPQPAAGELLAVFSTGAYHYSMASNYNRLPRPAVVLVHEGKSRLAVRRESYEDLIRNDVEEAYHE
ncbi:diaminopimelate decarboxylase [Proteiniclasticum sp. QWL-01]|uniref:diaminopimelate decarboxylase n=1 Tax=Proteiniclasticum sp. QWL-01 TaxID=3036945 RepID=UPI0024118F06|nr:diaminopimelate decarboxylase [Proteiniclasticum sp. QWL-01]WFF73595.1 diaminopimelate decarboxylase [Proteiniclasticum sp. QWL-01]